MYDPSRIILEYLFDVRILSGKAQRITSNIFWYMMYNFSNAVYIIFGFNIMNVQISMDPKNKYAKNILKKILKN